MPLRSKRESLPPGTSITWILSVSRWMYWYCGLLGERSGELAVGFGLALRADNGCVGSTLGRYDDLLRLDPALLEDLLFGLNLLLGDLLLLDRLLERVGEADVRDVDVVDDDVVWARLAASCCFAKFRISSRLARI